MKTAFILLAFVACAFAANGTFTQKVCSDAKCSKGCQSNSFPEGQCIPVQGGGSIVALCAPPKAPTELNQTYYQDSTTCTGASQNQISPLNKCQQDSSGSYFENLCTKARGSVSALSRSRRSMTAASAAPFAAPARTTAATRATAPRRHTGCRCSVHGKCS